MGEMWIDTPYAEEIEDHVEKWIGPIGYVIHEIVSDVVHIDVLVVRPSDDRPCFTLVTSGMSAKRMNVPEGAEDWARSELIISLPASNTYLAEEDPSSGQSDENKDSRAVGDGDPPGYYPVRHLTEYARYPHLENTWIGRGHTLVTADPPQPLGEDTQMTGYLFELPFAMSSLEGFNFQAKDGVQVNFLQMYPVHTDELNFKLKRGAEALMEKLMNSDVPNAIECFDPARPSVIKKKFFGLF